MKHATTKIAAAAALGAAMMYFLDPELGVRRRARMRELLGLQPRPASAPTPLRTAAAQDDAQLREQVRSRVDRLVSHPQAIDVRVENGVVRLSGSVLAKERDGLLSQVLHMPGVHRVINAMSAHDEPASLVRA